MKHIFTALLLTCSLLVIGQTQILFYTTLGEFTVEVREDLVPITAGNFIGLVESEFYDGIIFHRVISGFVIQGGDPTGTGSGGSGTIIPDEFTDSLSNVARTLSMANSGPNTGTSQFFINLVNNIYLDYDQPPLTSAHPVFGEVIDGWPTVLSIASTPVDASSRPITDMVMDSLRIINMASSVDELAANIAGYTLLGNPVTENSKLSVVLKSAEMLTISVFDIKGQQVGGSFNYLAAAGSNSIELQKLKLSSLENGACFLMISGEKGDVRAVPFTTAQ